MEISSFHTTIYHDSGTVSMWMEMVILDWAQRKRVQFDGTNIDIIRNIFIGTTSTQFISGSDSNIEISSSLFHLDPKNNPNNRLNKLKLTTPSELPTIGS